MKRMSLIVLVLATLSASAQTVEVTPSTPAAKLVQSLVTNELRDVYAPAGYQYFWTRNGRPTAQALAAIAQLEGAATHGLEPIDYDGGQWAPRIAALRNDAAIAGFDVDLTSAVMHYASDLRAGRVNPREVRFDYETSSKKLYMPAFIASVASSNDAAATLANVAPKHPEYQRLVAALAQYRRIASESQNDAPLPVVTKLTPGQSYDGLAQLATTLRRTGDLAADAQIDTTKYTGALVDAVKNFQSRHGLDNDGVIGKTTFAALNTPASRRVEQIEWALERWRWIEEVEGAKILVNIPEFKLTARDANGEELTMRVVVGKAAGHKTPVFGGDIKHVVLRPTWSVPPSIQRGEIGPKVAKDHGYLSRNNYELVDGAGRSVGSSVDANTVRRINNGSLRVRQKAGNGNALGLVKFLFPNDNNVYLHSTPQQALFARSRRDFSHGCVRVEDPVALAEWTLRNSPEWTREKIEAAMSGKRDDLYVKPSRPIEVQILYATAVAQENGKVHFYEDIYGHDVQLAKVLEPQKGAAPMLVAAK
jgi:murein L,D-transpeptidase YcbB/YkuD